jgi:hypothetical protein
MNVERDAFRTTLRRARLCLELDCNTIFDSARNRECPTCGSAEAYPLESWLNRHRLHALDHRPATGFPRTAVTVHPVVLRAVRAIEDARRVAVGQV